MISERTLELIHADIDGELAPAERPELEFALRVDRDAAALHADLRKVSDALAAMPPAERAPRGGGVRHAGRRSRRQPVLHAARPS